jgi:hypothetical protein
MLPQIGWKENSVQSGRLTTKLSGAVYPRPLERLVVRHVHAM